MTRSPPGELSYVSNRECPRVIGEGLIFPALGAKIKMEKGGNLGNPIPLPDGAAGQMDQIGDVAVALTATGGRACIGDLGIVQTG